MSDDKDEERHSQAYKPELITDPHERAELEARNALVQFDTAIEIIKSWTEHSDRKFRLRASLIMELHRRALEALSEFAGLYRPGPVKIDKSKHVPPEAALVPELVEEMCDYVNDHWHDKSPIHLASYLMWRLNWIHPFDDGNGRTSRMLSYVVLSIRMGHLIPGQNTIPEQIAEDKSPYYRALESADEAFKNGIIDVSVMEDLIEKMLGNQLVDIYENAKNTNNLEETGRKLH